VESEELCAGKAFLTAGMVNGLSEHVGSCPSSTVTSGYSGQILNNFSSATSSKMSAQNCIFGPH
jgi:hypothetical protein